MNAAGSAAAPGIHRPGGLLWHRDFRLLWSGETVSQVGTAMAVVAMPLAAVTVLQAGTFAEAGRPRRAWYPADPQAVVTTWHGFLLWLSVGTLHQQLRLPGSRRFTPGWAQGDPVSRLDV